MSGIKKNMKDLITKAVCFTFLLSLFFNNSVAGADNSGIVNTSVYDAVYRAAAHRSVNNSVYQRVYDREGFGHKLILPTVLESVYSEELKAKRDLRKTNIQENITFIPKEVFGDVNFSGSLVIPTHNLTNQINLNFDQFKSEEIIDPTTQLSTMKLNLPIQYIEVKSAADTRTKIKTSDNYSVIIDIDFKEPVMILEYTIHFKNNAEVIHNDNSSKYQLGQQVGIYRTEYSAQVLIETELLQK
ncbi:hypothetical protein [Paenibacillus agricola]|uniref:Toxin ETX/toxin MTX2 n=1 Tax=Paenibacillus agricola TaxID=2716264 RepID=A0ABX0JI44_9BACL|nr:hypothetical protein [Paenibacillus agricola]NHN35526.1 hypothetical protein [Paenibacillus agricola]